MNLNVTLEFACYTQYGVYMYIFIYGKIQGLLLQKQKQSLIIPITAFCGRVIFYTRECQKQQILYYHETQHQNNL